MKTINASHTVSRNFIRHPTEIPIEIEQSGQSIDNDQLRDIGMGGLSFSSDSPYSINDIIKISVKIVKPAFETPCRVVWCHSNSGTFDIGVEFLNKDDMFRARMVEQVCHIEQYKKTVELKEGRNISCEQAAEEWINKFAAEFPTLQR